jgi:uncharacterized protein YfeS
MRDRSWSHVISIQEILLIVNKYFLFVVFFYLVACNDKKPFSPVYTREPDHQDSIQRHLHISQPEKSKTHVGAKSLMNEDWLFSVSDDNAPFGSDDAADTYAAFWEWRMANENGDPKNFLENQLRQWGYPVFDYTTTDYWVLQPYLENNKLGWRYLFGTDAAIIATAFGQLYMEGSISKGLKEMAIIAVKRESTHEIIQSWEEKRPEREKKLKKLGAILLQASEGN